MILTGRRKISNGHARLIGQLHRQLIRGVARWRTEEFRQRRNLIGRDPEGDLVLVNLIDDVGGPASVEANHVARQGNRQSASRRWQRPASVPQPADSQHTEAGKSGPSCTTLPKKSGPTHSVADESATRTDRPYKVRAVRPDRGCSAVYQRLGAILRFVSGTFDPDADRSSAFDGPGLGPGQEHIQLPRGLAHALPAHDRLHQRHQNRRQQHDDADDDQQFGQRHAAPPVSRRPQVRFPRARNHALTLDVAAASSCACLRSASENSCSAS